MQGIALYTTQMLFRNEHAGMASSKSHIFYKNVVSNIFEIVILQDAVQLNKEGKCYLKCSKILKLDIFPSLLEDG